METSQKQCSLPVAKRVGGWSCPGTVSQPDPLAGSLAKKRGTRFCEENRPNCWTVRDDFDAEFRGVNDYGYYDKVLGTYSWGFTTQLQGLQSRSKPVWIQFNNAVENLTIEGARIYFNRAHRSGAYFNPNETWNHYVEERNPVSGYVSWEPNGYKAREDSGAELEGVIHTFKWNVYGYPGTWTTYAKSPEFKLDGDVYRYMTAYNLPEQAWGDFWKP